MSKKQYSNELYTQVLNEFEESSFDALLRDPEGWEAGIDEAGRGPVMGPMVYGILAWPIALKHRLEALDFNDSKALSEQQRE